MAEKYEKEHIFSGQKLNGTQNVAVHNFKRWPALQCTASTITAPELSRWCHSPLSILFLPAKLNFNGTHLHDRNADTFVCVCVFLAMAELKALQIKCSAADDVDAVATTMADERCATLQKY